MEVTYFVSQIKHFLDYPTVYVNGAFGAVASDSNKKRYHNSANVARWTKIQNCPSNGFFADCCGIVKAVLWGWTGDTSKIYGGASYKANNIPDLNELGLINACSDVSTDFSRMVAGELVWMKGHCGVYIGDGLVVESTPAWDCGVQITGVKNLNRVYNGKSRTWTKHGRLPWVDYSGKPAAIPTRYTLESFRKDCRAILGVTTNAEACINTPKISTAKVNRHHALVTPLERIMKSTGYYTGKIEADEGEVPDFGSGMKKAVEAYQKDNFSFKPDGVLSPNGATWNKLLLG